MSLQQDALVSTIQAISQQAVAKSDTYHSAPLNGWDYVVAISQQQVNYGLRELYDAGKLPKSFSKTENILGMEVVFKGGFGKPRVQAVADGLKLCDLILPLENATMQTPMGPTRIPHGAALRITTSLAAFEAKIKKGKGREYEVYVDLKNENAAYNVHIDGLPKDQVAIIENLLKKELQSLSGREYRLTSYTIDDQGLGSYIPKLVDFSFVMNKEDPDASPFVLACAMNDKGPQVENRLVFNSNILPGGLPAALWLSDRHIIGTTMAPELNSALRSSYPAANLTYKGRGEMGIARPFSMGRIEGYQTDMEELTIKASGGRLQIANRCRVKDITIFKIDAIAWVWGHMAISVSKDQTSFSATSAIDKNKVDTKGPSLAVQIVLGIITLGIIPIILSVIENAIQGKVGDASKGALGSKLKDVAKEMNKLAGNVSALQSLSFNGNLLFDEFHLHDNGDVCIGVVGIKHS